MDAMSLCKLYEEAKALRQPYEQDWKTAAAFCKPRDYAQWGTLGSVTPQSQMAARRQAYDSTGVRSLPKYQAVLQRLATPEGQRWHMLGTSNPALNRITAVKEYYQEVTRLLFAQRGPVSGFADTQSTVYGNIGVYGFAPKYVGKARRRPGMQSTKIAYVACSPRDVFFLFDDEGKRSTAFRRLFLNARQFTNKFPGVTPPKCIAAELAKVVASETTKYEFFHVVGERGDFDPSPRAMLSNKRFPMYERYVCVQDQQFVGDEGGYLSNPYIAPTVFADQDNPYGYSPAMQALPALGTLSAMKKTLLKAGQKAVDPTLLAAHDGVVGKLNLLPAHVNYGAIDNQGRRLVMPMEVGRFDFAQEQMQDERRDVEDAFFVTLFQILTETPEMTATEVVERVAEKAALYAPTMGVMQRQDLAPTIQREIDVLAEAGELPDMPPELVEANGEYDITYTSPLAKSLFAEEVSGFARSVEIVGNIVSVTQDPSAFDVFDFDTAIPEIADRLGVPVRWIATPDQMKAKGDNRAQQAQSEQMVQAAPALASVAGAAISASKRK